MYKVQRKHAAMTTGRRRLLLAEDPSTSHCHAGGVHSGHEQNITLIMIVVILVFMLCNAPARLVQVTSRIHSLQSICIAAEHLHL